MKYITIQSHTQAISTISHIEQSIELNKNKQVIMYAEPEMITNKFHVLSGQYVIPIATKGWLKCDQLFDTQQLVDMDTTWYDTVSTDI